MKTIDNLTLEECRYLRQLIGNGTRPIRVARHFFPKRQKGYVNETKNIRAYLLNKSVALDETIPWDRRKDYISICSQIYIELSQEAKDLEFFPDDCPHAFNLFRPVCCKCEFECPFL